MTQLQKFVPETIEAISLGYKFNCGGSWGNSSLVMGKADCEKSTETNPCTVYEVADIDVPELVDGQYRSLVES